MNNKRVKLTFDPKREGELKTSPINVLKRIPKVRFCTEMCTVTKFGFDIIDILVNLSDITPACGLLSVLYLSLFRGSTIALALCHFTK